MKKKNIKLLVVLACVLMAVGNVRLWKESIQDIP